MRELERRSSTPGSPPASFGAPITAMELDPESLGARDMYEWMTTTILPRPIAWVSTVSTDGKTNLAPFSFFQGVCARPPTLLFCPANDRHGRPKDTLVNVEATGEFVVNLVPFALAESMNATAATLPYGESEFDRFHIAPAPSTQVRPPRVAAAPVAFECRLDRVIRIGEGPIAGHVVLGRIVHFHVQESVLAPDGKPDPAQLDLVGRAGRNDYVRLGELFRLERPS